MCCRAWHAANTAAQEPAEDEEEDEILPELGGRDSTATGLGLNAPDCAPPNGDSQRADVSPARPGLAVSQQPQVWCPVAFAFDCWRKVSLCFSHCVSLDAHGIFLQLSSSNAQCFTGAFFTHQFIPPSHSFPKLRAFEWLLSVGGCVRQGTPPLL